MADSDINKKSDGKELSTEEAINALNDILNAINEPQNVSRIEEAKEKAGNDMIKMMQYVFPIVAQIQIECIKNHGFTADGQGAIKFTLAVQSLETADSEVARLSNELKNNFIPQLTLPTLSS